MRKLILIALFLFGIISFLGCSAKAAEPEIKVDVTLSDLTDEEYTSTQGGGKVHSGTPKEKFKKLSVDVKIINSKDATNRTIQIPDLRVGQMENRVAAGGSPTRNNIGSEDVAHETKYIIFNSEELKVEELKEIYNPVILKASYKMVGEDFKKKKIFVGKEMTIVESSGETSKR